MARNGFLRGQAFRGAAARNVVETSRIADVLFEEGEPRYTVSRERVSAALARSPAAGSIHRIDITVMRT